jgi:hypothetical protein
MSIIRNTDLQNLKKPEDCDTEFKWHSCVSPLLLTGSAISLLAGAAMAAPDAAPSNAHLDVIAREALLERGATGMLDLRKVDEMTGGNHDNSVRISAYR